MVLVPLGLIALFSPASALDKGLDLRGPVKQAEQAFHPAPAHVAILRSRRARAC